MADTEVRDTLEHATGVEGVNGVQDMDNGDGSASKAADAKLPLPVASKPTSRDATPALPSPGSGLVPLRGSTGSTVTPTLNMPNPKRFSHVDINKRFLEQNSQGSTGSHTPVTSSVAKTANSTQKPVLQTAPSHSRLVTAKLTADTQRSSTTGPGWSRPSSTNSSIAATPASGTNTKPTPAPTPSTSHGAPLPGPIGKVIQPQPRSTDGMTSLVRKDSSGKPAWRNPAASVATVGSLDPVQNEFPTAAEVAQVNSAKLVEKKQAAQVVAAQKQAMAAEADAFRGVHLGPNVHHWDEDEGDDSNFLDEVIEFDDGRQYTIPQAKSESPPPGESPRKGESSAKHDLPVSKEERFADDFDRSWPPSRNANGPPHDRASQPLLSPSATSSQSLHSPQDSSRVLFNERSNKLEPYSHPQGRFPGPSREPPFGRRGSRSDTMGSPVDLRGGRDAPPHTAGVQLLQKSSPNGHLSSPLDDAPPRSRIFGDRPGFDPSHDGNRFRDREFSKRDGHPFGNRPSHGPDPNRPKDYHNGSGLPPPIAPPDRSRRFPQMGPPPVPVPGSMDARDGRQMPPHLSGVPPQHQMWRAPSNSERPRRLSTASSISQTQASTTSQAPPVHTPVTPDVMLSPEVPQAPSAVPIMDLDEVRKAAMHSAAERAKLRRQQEEEEREKERERARKKAAEIEAKLKAAEEEKVKTHQEKTASEAQVVAIIEDAVRSVALDGVSETPRGESSSTISHSAPKAPFGRAPSSRGSLRPASERRPSILTPVSPGISPAAEAETWRSKVVQPPPQPPLPMKQSTSLTLLEQVDSFSLSMDDSYEVVDFSEHGKLVGVTSPEVEEPEPAFLRKPARPHAADFFQDEEDHPSQKASLPSTVPDEGSWRRKVSPVDEHPPLVDQPPERPKLQITPTPYHAPPAASYHKVPHVHYDEQDRRPKEHSQLHPSHSHPPLKSPVTPSYREAPMAALDDTMARIRGALDGMHKPLPNQKWLPPALRPQQPSEKSVNDELEEHGEREVFDVTRYESPKSPKPAWSHFTVRLPHTSSSREPPPSKRLRGFTSGTYIRLDLLSLPPYGNGKRLFQLNDTLFSRPPMLRGRIEYKVSLPKPPRSRITEDGLVVNLPALARPAKTAPAGAFGRPREADGLSSWRKPPSSPLREKDVKEATNGLDTVSRSPPPEPPVSLPASSIVTPSSPTVSVPAKGKASPKVPNGSGVAFYREARVESADGTSSALVKFIVNSELDEDDPVDSRSPGKLLTPAQPVSALLAEDYANVASPAEFKMDIVRAPTSSSSSPWTKSREIGKESTTSDAMQEHVKAIWTSKSNKIATPSENLLEGIANDLAVVPFTMPEAKLEEPPAAPARAVSRMSSQDVARAFQQVPNSPANHAAAKVNGPSPNYPPPRQPALPMAGSMMPPGVRAAYPSYPAPMMSSPSPTLGYPPAMTPSPVPRPMVASSPHYAPQAMWVAMPPPNGPPGMMRQVASPYGPQLMPYPPGGPMPMYAPHPPGGAPTHHPNSVHGRTPTVMMSPVPPQAQPAPHPMYATSPVMMSAHAMPGMPPPGTPYAGPAPQGRGPVPHQRGAYDPSMLQQSASYGSQPPSAYPLPPNSYARTSW